MPTGRGECRRVRKHGSTSVRALAATPFHGVRAGNLVNKTSDEVEAPVEPKLATILDTHKHAFGVHRPDGDHHEAPEFTSDVKDRSRRSGDATVRDLEQAPVAPKDFTHRRT